VVEFGAGVTGLRPGDPVAALTHASAGATGGYAEYAVAPAELVYPLPGVVELSAAAALPCVLTTAYGLLTVAGLATGETVLVHGAAGGVGSAAVQVARALGAGTLIGTVGRPDKIEYARQLGYDQVFLRAEFADRIADLPGPGVDIALDGVGGPTRVRNLDVLAPLGRLVVFGDPGQGDDLAVSTNRLWFEAKAVLGFNIGELAAKTPSTVRRMALAALRLLADGRVDMAVAEVFPLDRAADAHRLLESGRSTGKILLAM
jgi:NADPH2:quinone reductase